MYIAAVGNLDAQDRNCLEAAGRRAGIELVVAVDVPELMREQVPERGLPGCLFVPRQGDYRAVVGAIRDVGELFAIPLIALVEHPSESAFCAALAAGANDAVITGDVNGVLRRLASLAISATKPRPPKHNGLAVIASTDVPRRRQLGRTLRQAGFEITFASVPEEVQSAARGPVAPTLLVTTPSFAPHGIPATGLKGTGPGGVETVVLGEAQQVALGAATGTDTTGELLFRAEEALRGGVQERRASARIHFATVCSFRKSGDLQPNFGLTHNISAGGLYVRTLDVPAAGASLWIELRVPYTNQTVHLRGEVVSVTSPASGTARPPGFGIKLLNEQCLTADLDAFLATYTELAARNLVQSN